MRTWQEIPLSEIAAPVSRPIAVVPGTAYRTMGVKWWGEGAYERATIDGSNTAAKTLSVVRADDLVINKIWVRHGSTAVAGSEVDGCAASGEFPTFALDREQVLPRWIHWLVKTRTFWSKCDSLSRGSSGKNRIKPELFLSIRVPLPPLPEQRRIVARIEALAAEIDEAKRLRREAVEEGETLCRAILENAVEIVPTRMSELVNLKPSDVAVQADEVYHFAGVYCFGRGVFASVTKLGMEFSYPRLSRLRQGDFVYPKLMAWEGAMAVVSEECDGLVVSTEFPVFEVNSDRVHPEVLDVYFRDPAIWPKLSGSSTGTNVRRRRLNPGDFLKHEFPLPDRVTQDKLRAVRREMDALKRLQSETAAELDALLPAILDRAFKGEL